MAIKVKAFRRGYYDLKRKKEGEVFFIAETKNFSKRWMEDVDGVLGLDKAEPEAAEAKEPEVQPQTLSELQKVKPKKGQVAGDLNVI